MAPDVFTVVMRKPEVQPKHHLVMSGVRPLQTSGPLHDSPAEAMEEQLTRNVLSPILTRKKFLLEDPQNPRGTIPYARAS